MSLVITVNNVDYTVPSSAADENWAAQVIAFWQALAAAATTGANAVLLTGNQNVGGIKHFTSTLVADGAANVIGTLSCGGELVVGTVAGFGIDSLSDDTTGAPGDVINVTTMRGRSSIAAGHSSCVFTGMSAVGATSQVLVTMESNDATAKYLRVDSISAGTFTVSANANATADCVFTWLIFGSIN